MKFLSIRLLWIAAFAVLSPISGFAIVKKAQPHQVHKKVKATYKRSSSHSSSSKDTSSKLSEISEFLSENFPCSPSIPIDHVPFEILESGKYCVTADLVYNGSAAAIWVQADNVTINFADHSLTLNDSAAQGILVDNVNEFVLLNDQILGSSPFKTATSAAVHLVNVNKATISNVYTLNTTRGIQIDDSIDVLVHNSFLQFHEGLTTTAVGAGIGISGSTGVTINSCTFEGASTDTSNDQSSQGVLIEDGSQNVSLLNSTFTGWQSSIAALSVTGLLVDQVQAIASNVTDRNLMVLGSDDAQANEVTIKDSHFVQNVLVPGFDGLYFFNGTGCILENVIVDTRTSVSDGYLPGAIHVGCTGNGGCDSFLSYSNMLAANVIVKGSTNTAGLYIENGNNITFDQSQFTNAINFNVLIDSSNNNTIKNSTITNSTGSGILISNFSNNNAIINCEVTSNLGDGISIQVDGNLNHLRGNSIWDNGIGINNLGSNTETFFNTSCHNDTDDCVNVFPEQAAGESPAVAGSNICCDFIDSNT